MHERLTLAARAAARARCPAAIIAASLLAFSAPAMAAHKGGVSPAWGQCRAPDPDARIAGCTQVIQEIDKETPHNKVAAYVNRAGAYQAKGDYAHALEDFGKALEFEPKSSVILAARGAAHHAKGDLDSSLADYDQAIAADKKNAAALLARAYVWRAKGDVDKALADL
ncbi:MAG: tetratricopeptide repeat protein, partial [Methylocystis sp.]|nr:tetratricopeptide repeat protein [Methylocystis sp.]